LSNCTEHSQQSILLDAIPLEDDSESASVNVMAMDYDLEDIALDV